MATDSELPQVESPALAALVARGYVDAASDLAGIDQALMAGKLSFYIGYDPTASSLHIGHLLTVMAARSLQAHGHRPLVVLGGATAGIGDPAGRNEVRAPLDEAEIRSNLAGLRRQFPVLLQFDTGAPSDARIIDNSDWLESLRYVAFLREIGHHFTVNRMIAAKTARDRLETEQPLSLLEFNYQLLQAYDFLHLYNAEGCVLQIGGADQWANMIAGVELIRRVGAEQREDTERNHAAYCVAAPLLTGADGVKMGKTTSGTVWLDAELCSPFDYYQYWINCHDGSVEQLLRLFTELPLADIAALCDHEGAGLREAKATLAYEATRLLHGEQAAARSRRATEQAFGDGEDWSALPCIELAFDELRLLELVVHDEVRGFKSKRVARERIKAGAVKLDGEAVTDHEALISASGCGDDGLRVQIGRKKRLRVKLTGA